MIEKLEYPSERARKLLLIGGEETPEGFLKAKLVEICHSSDQVKALIFDFVKASEIKKPHFFLRWLMTIRAFSLTATLSPAIAVVLFGLWWGWDLSVASAIIACLGLALLQMSVNVLNDVEDYLLLIDGPKRRGGSGVLEKAWISAKDLKRVGIAFLILGLLCGAFLFYRAPIVVAAVCAIALIGVWGYSSRPFGFKYRALGDLNVFILTGPALSIGMSAVSFQMWNESVVILGCIFGLLSCAFLHLNNLEDIEVDQSRGAYTLASLLGFRKAKYLPHLFYGLSGLLILFLVFAEEAPAAFILSIPLLAFPILKLLRRLSKATGPFCPSLTMIRMEGAEILTLSGLVFILIFGISFFLQ